eukprot:TRINITY_DN23146_c0_g1_i1.p1 TRINITY_DN23146_c0_g1~~TRINITY_DN23146_c0_g1_i1.p1  ORF type:complete len:104 (+),score=16.89 TRINITY_DN23146_c0_g1_i1:28-312(+)
MTDLPDSVMSLSNLEELSLQDNKVNALNFQAIGPCVSLQTLDLSNNLISVVSTGAHMAQSITSLNLSGNNISKLPHDIGGMPMLINLNLSGNVR